MLSGEIEEFLADFRPRTHAIVFYDSPDHKHELLFSHLRFGMRDQGLAYVCSEETPKQIREEMTQSGIDVDGLKGKDQLLIRNYDDVYIVKGEVSIPLIMEQFSSLSKKYNRAGLRGLRASAEMSCFFRHNKVRELLAYEYALHRRLAFSAEGICAYNVIEMAKMGCLDMIMPVLRAHDPVILMGPKDSLILPPEKIEENDVEQTFSVKDNTPSIRA